MEVKKGRYKHYKGKFYKVLGIGRHSETLEEFVVYQALYDSEEFSDNSLWIRPLEMFISDVEFDGKKVKRFEYADE